MKLKQPPKWLKISTGLLWLVLILYWLIPSESKKDSNIVPESPKKQIAKVDDNNVATMSAARKLAILDYNEDLPENHPRVLELKNILDSCSLLFNSPADSIAQYTSKCNSLLSQYGIEKSNTEIMLSIYTDYYKYNKEFKIKYSEATALYAMILTKNK